MKAAEVSNVVVAGAGTMGASLVRFLPSAVCV